MPEISVLMSVYKEERAIVAEAVGSVLAQTFRDFEFIIMCDDPENDAAISYLNILSTTEPRLRVFVNEHNLGLVESLNRGLKYCEGKYIARMDADDRTLPERFKKQKKYLEEKDLDMVGCLYRIYFDPVQSGRIHPSPESPQEIAETLKHYDCMGHPTWLVKTEVYKALGGYRSIRTCEDYDFLIRAVRAGFKLGNLQEALYWYRISPEGVSQRNRAEQRSITRFLAYNMMHDRDTTMEDLEAFAGSREFRALKKLYEAQRRYKGDLTVKGERKLKDLIAFVRVLASPESVKVYLKYIRG